FDGTNWLSIGSGGNGGGGGGGIGGSGTPNALAKWTAVGTLGDSGVTDDTRGVTFGLSTKTTTVILSSATLTINGGNAQNLDLGNTTLVYVNSAAPISIKCVKAPTAFGTGYKMVYLVNNGNHPITFAYNDASCQPDDKFFNITNNDLVLSPKKAILIRHNAPRHYWEVIKQ
ncbi:MAG: hypothetical protein ACKOW9_00515, partial [Candidatus Paceibacterota bacterium]